MILSKPRVEFLDSNQLSIQLIEQAGRTCYKSEDKMTDGSDLEFVQRMIDNGHDAMLEFGWMAFRAICNRGVTHEIVRHRLFSYAQESTRYCNYKGGVEFIIPHWSTNIYPGVYDETDIIDSTPTFTEKEIVWLQHKIMCEKTYQEMIELGQTPQDARDNLPIATKTEICIAGNFREWRHFFKLRTNKKAHPQMIEVADMTLNDSVNEVPIIFDEYV